MAAAAPPTPTAPHPRLRTRRAEVQRALGRRRLRRLVAFAGLLVVVAAVAGAVRSPLLDVDHIDVTGAERLAPGDVRRASGLEPGMAMFDVDPGAAASRLRAQPWIRRADVERRWPGRVSIHVVERRPAAVAPHPGGGMAVVDDDGHVIALSPTPVAGLVRVDVPAGQPGTVLPASARSLLRLVRALPARAAAEVVGARTDGGELALDLVDGGVVRIGAAERLGEKVQALDVLLTTIPGRCIGALDLRAPTVPALTRVNGCA